MTFQIIGCGMYLPQNVMLNDDFMKSLDTSDEWIKSRTGIAQRHIASGGEYTSHMAHFASEAALTDAGINASDIDLIIVCTTTADNSFPSVSAKLQGYLGLKGAPAFDLQAACSGFVYGLHVADSMGRSNAYNTILVVGAEKMSSLLDWTDRATCVLFGDGAGAVVLKRNPHNDSGIIDSQIFADGSYYDILFTDGGISMNATSGKIKMQGREIFKQGVEKMSSAITDLLARNQLTVADIDFLVPHQANIRMINSIATRLGVGDDKIVATVDMHANCSAASIPLALAEAKKQGKFKSGDLVMMTAFGAGITWGAVVIRW